MAVQNIYDNAEFFESYFDLRQKGDNFNLLLEQPAMMELLPDIKGKRVLDLGCGFGDNCNDFVKRGAESVTGIDISEKMLAVARKENAHSKIEYFNMGMDEVGALGDNFDLVYSSLAFHYIENFDKLISNIYDKLNDNGILLFSQEHPFITATIDGKGHFNRDEKGVPVSYTFSNYCQRGLRKSTWFVDGVEKYHRTIGDVLTTLASNGFCIEKVVEPIPSEEALKIRPNLKKELLKPNFLIVKARKL